MMIVKELYLFVLLPKGAGIMTEAIEKVFKKEFDEKKEAGIQETMDKVIMNMLRGNEPVDKIILYTQASLEKIASIAKSIGISSLTL